MSIRCHIAARSSARLASLGIVTLALLNLGCTKPRFPQTQGEAAPPLTWETVFHHDGVSRAVLSPNGLVAAVVQGSRITVRSTTENAVASEAVDGRWPEWSPDGRQLSWINGQRLWLGEVTADGRPAIVNPAPISSTLAGMRSPSWSPNGDQIAVFGAQYGPEGHQDIYLLETDDGGNEPARYQLTSSAAVGDDIRFTPQWSPDGKWIAYISNQNDWWHDDVWLVNVASGKTHQISLQFMASSSPIWSPTSTTGSATLVTMGTAKDGYWYQDLADLFRIDLDLSGTEPITTREAPIKMQVYATDFIMRFDPYFSGDGKTVFFPYHERGTFDLWAVPAVGGVATRVTNLGGAWSSLHASSDGTKAVVVRDAPTEGREAWLIESAGEPPRALTAHTPRFQGVQVPQEISFRTFDGLYLQGFLYLPPTLLHETAGDTNSCPAIVQVHGGGTNSYYQGTNLTEQVLAARGFPVLAINYRGGSGFGREFQDLNVEDWLNDQSKDPGAAADWLRAQPWSNGKVGIYGGSYGGMQSMSAITRTPEKFDAAVPMRGIYSEALTLPFADRLGKIFTITGHGGTPEERPDTYRKSETLERMDKITAPVLMMHGERDVRAPFRNFELAVERLEELGKEFESKTYPEGHGFRDPANLTDMYTRLENFFEKHLGKCN